MSKVTEASKAPTGNGGKSNENQNGGEPSTPQKNEGDNKLPDGSITSDPPPPEKNTPENPSPNPEPDLGSEQALLLAEKKRMEADRSQFEKDRVDAVEQLRKEMENFQKEKELFEKEKSERAAAAEAARLQAEKEAAVKPPPPVTNPAPPPVIPVSNFRVPAKQSRTFVLSGGNNPRGNHTIIAVEDVIDPATGRPRRARLLRGATSIWMDEQKQFETIKGYVEKNQLSLVFQKGKMIVSLDDKMRNDFIDLSNRNMDNEKRNKSVVMKEYFAEWNTEKQATAALKAEEDEFEAMRIASTTMIDLLIPHAQYLGVDFTDPVSGHPLDEKGIRTAYFRKAKEDPRKFLDSIHSPVVQMRFKVKRAMSEGIIDMGRQPNQAFWRDGGFISVIPVGRDSTDYLTEFAQMQGEANAQFVNQLNALIS